MANHLRRQIREGAATALTGLTTSGARVYQSRTHELQDSNLPGLRIYTNDEELDIESLGVNRLQSRDLDLVVEACSKKSADLDDELDAMIKEVEVALAGAQDLGVGVKWVQLKSIQIEMEGEAEKEIGIARMIFNVRYITALATPDVPQ